MTKPPAPLRHARTPAHLPEPPPPPSVGPEGEERPPQEVRFAHHQGLLPRHAQDVLQHKRPGGEDVRPIWLEAGELAPPGKGLGEEDAGDGVDVTAGQPVPVHTRGVVRREALRDGRHGRHGSPHPDEPSALEGNTAERAACHLPHVREEGVHFGLGRRIVGEKPVGQEDAPQRQAQAPRHLPPSPHASSTLPPPMSTTTREASQAPKPAATPANPRRASSSPVRMRTGTASRARSSSGFSAARRAYVPTTTGASAPSRAASPR